MAIRWCVANFVVAAALMWWDPRAFALYAFAHVLWGLCYLDYLRALLRVSTGIMQGKLDGIAIHVGVTEDEWEVVAQAARRNGLDIKAMNTDLARIGFDERVTW